MMEICGRLMNNCFLFAVLACLAICGNSSDDDQLNQFAPNAERRIREHILFERNYSARERPVLNSADTLNVTIGIFLHAMLHLRVCWSYVTNPLIHLTRELLEQLPDLTSHYIIIDVNQKDQTVKTASWVAFMWKDPRLVWDPEDFEGQDLISLHHDEVWLPTVNLGNGLETVSVIDPTQGWIVLSSEGEIYLGSAFIQSSYCPIRIKYFPFDSQTCVLKFNSQNVPSEKVFLKAGNPVMSPTLSSSEWDIISMNGTQRIFNEVNVIGNRPLLPFSQVRFCLHVTRFPRYYVILLIIPSTILNIMALMTFFSPPDGGERISLSISMILGLTVFQLLVADLLPVTREEDTPVLSTYLISNFILAVLAIPFSLVTVNVMFSDTTLRKRETLLQKVISILIPILRFFKLLKKTEQKTRKVGVQSKPVKIISLPNPRKDVMDNPILLNQMVNPPREDENMVIGEEESPVKDVNETRHIANALDRMFFLLFFSAIVIMFLVMVFRYQRVGDYHQSRGCPS